MSPDSSFLRARGGERKGRGER